jgi:DNA-cytosine methyltransferase
LEERLSYCEDFNKITRLAINLREILSEKIAENLRKTKLDQALMENRLLPFEDEIRYYPMENASEAILLTQSTLHCLVRFLSCHIERRLNHEYVDVFVLQRRIDEIEKRADIPAILKPFVDPRLEDIDTITLSRVVDLVRPISVFECLLMMGILYERSHWEIIIPNNHSSSSRKRTEIYDNLAFANKNGIFYTPPEIAYLIVKQTFGKFLDTHLNLMRTNSSEAKDLLSNLFGIKACDPACGSSVFMLYFLKTLFDALPQVYEFAIKNNVRLEPPTELKKSIIENMIYGVDSEEDAVQLSRVILCLFSGIDLDSLPKTALKLRTGDALVSEEILGSPVNPRKKREKRTLEPFFTEKPRSLKVFNWSEEYPELKLYHETGGFDFIFLNPPYGRLKVHRSDFTDGETLSRFSGRELDRELINAKKHFDSLSQYFRKSGDYTLSCEGELDWHRIMIERALRLLKQGGRIGFIVPSTILADIRSTPLRRYLLKNCVVEEIYYLPETAGLFATVNQSTCIFVTRKTAGLSEPIAMIKAENAEGLLGTQPKMISTEIISTLDPNTLPIPVIDEQEYPILKKMYQYARVGSIAKLENMRGELDLTSHKCYISDNVEDILLIRGDNIERFVCRHVSESRKATRVRPVFLEDTRSFQRNSHLRCNRIVGRQCSYLGKKRRLSFSIVVSNSVVSNSCNYLVSYDLNDFPLVYLLGLLNSSLIEWRFRVTNSNNHVSNHEIDQLPLPPRSKHPILSSIVINSAENLVDYYSNLEFGTSKEPRGMDEDRLDAATFLIYGISEDEADHVLTQIGEQERCASIKDQMRRIQSSILYDHTVSEPSNKEKEMIQHIPPGGNWQDIPVSIPSQRLEQIRRMTEERGAVVRTTYYGRLRWDHPSYTISTYFSRIGNGCFIHPKFNRLISLREAARLQSFRDCFRFYGSRTSKYKQIGNAVPPLLAMAIAKTLQGKTLVAPFCGAGGLSEGFRMASYRILAAQDIDENSLLTYKMNGLCQSIVKGNIRKTEIKQRFIELAKAESGNMDIDVVAAGPPCTGFSLAGWYQRDDPRNELVYDFLDIVKALMPKFVVMENVQGLVWMKKGAVIKELLKTIEDMGYKVEYQVLNAEQFGVPQLRRRVVVIGSSLGRPRFPKPLFGGTGLDVRRPFTVEDAISDLSKITPDKETDETLYDGEYVECDYQRWCRGMISTEELFKRREFPWVGSEERRVEHSLEEGI